MAPIAGRAIGVRFERIPGRHSIDIVTTPSGLGQHRFNPGELSFELTKGRTIYYLGDVTMDWRGMGSGASLALMVAGTATAGVLGGAATSRATQGAIVVSVRMEEAAARDAFSRRFHLNQQLVASELSVRPEPPSGKP